MSNHFSAAYLKLPDGDTRLDLTDVFVFTPARDPDTTVLILDVNPYMHGLQEMTPPEHRRPEFHPDRVHRINVDTDGDAVADVAFTFTFTSPIDGVQQATAWLATGEAARVPEPGGEILIAEQPFGLGTDVGPLRAGPVTLFIGVRSDPFYADAEGALHGYVWTGHDDFAGKNILSFALAVPTSDCDGPRFG